MTVFRLENVSLGNGFELTPYNHNFTGRIMSCKEKPGSTNARTPMALVVKQTTFVTIVHAGLFLKAEFSLFCAVHDTKG